MKRLLFAFTLAAVASVPAIAGDLKAELIESEKVMWRAWGDGDTSPFTTHLTEDHSSLVAGVGLTRGRDAVIAGIAEGNCTLNSFEFDDVGLSRPVEDVAILTYLATSEASCDGHALPPRVYATAVYVHQDGAWKVAHYQETAAE